MQRLWMVMGLIVVLVVTAVLPVAAQDDLTAEEQAALAEVRAAFENWLALDTYSGTIFQIIQQDIVIDAMGQKMTVVQTIEGKGESQVEMVEGAYPNQVMVLTQSITQDMGRGAPQVIGPMEIGVIMLDGSTYMQMTVPPAMGGYLPEGWQDITEDASAFGMPSFDMNQLFQLSAGTLTSDYLDTVLSSTQAVELLGEDTINGIAVNRYALTLDISVAVEALGGADNIEQMLSGMQTGIDMEAMLEQMYDPANSSFVFELSIGVEDHMVYEFITHMVTNLVLTKDMLDASLGIDEMSIVQDVVATLLIYGFNEPVTIEAPALGE